MSVRIGRIREVDSPRIDEMLEHVVHEEDQKPAAFIQMVKASLEKAPSGILVLGALKDDELVGFAVAFDISRPHIWISQFWAKTGLSKKVADAMFDRIYEWTQALGKVEIRAESTRSAAVMYRRIGFEQHAVVLKLSVEEEVDEVPVSTQEVSQNG